MKSNKTIAIVLAAGSGARMKSAQPKVMHQIAGRPMIKLLIASILEAGIDKIVVVLGKDMKELVKEVHPHRTVIQNSPLGTGHAALQAVQTLGKLDENILILNGDNPMVGAETIQKLTNSLYTQTKSKLAVLGFCAKDPAAYGRMVLDSKENLQRIVETRDASCEEQKINLCSAGIMLISGSVVADLLKSIKNNNSQKEYYLSDIIEIAQSRGIRCITIRGNEKELLGINSRAELAQAELTMQEKLRNEAMANGVTLIDAKTVWLSWDTKLGQDITIDPNVYFGKNVTIEDQVHIKSFCHIEGAKIASGSIIGPFARLRPETIIKENVHIGNFVEVKNSLLKSSSKANHLAYIGDASVGVNANIGAGTITCNYNGFSKSQTHIDDNAFIGSNTALVAPVKIGAGAIIGAGSVINQNIEPHSLALTRPSLKKIKNGAKRQRKLLNPNPKNSSEEQT